MAPYNYRINHVQDENRTGWRMSSCSARMKLGKSRAIRCQFNTGESISPTRYICMEIKGEITPPGRASALRRVVQGMKLQGLL